MVNQDMETDTIDLTGSSPEPAQRPRLPPQQQRLQTYFKTEPQDGPSGSARIKTEPKTSGIRSRGSQQRSRQINPQHLALIMETSSSQALKTVLLNLCKTSPALSGALARGLAPHSTFAQALIRQQRQKQQAQSQQAQERQASASRPVKREDLDQAAYERMKQRLKAQQNLKSPRLNRGPATPTAEGSRSRFAGSQSVPRIKREAPQDIGDTDSDNDSFIPGSFSHSAQQLKSGRPAQRDASSRASSSVFREPTLNPFPARLARAQETSRIKTEREKCTLCHKMIVDQFETCFSHASEEVDDAGDLKCCNEPVWEMGCVVGLHVTESEALLKRSQPGGSQSPSKGPFMC
jgi:hypothetical protein